jgi:hypothetical protein
MISVFWILLGFWEREGWIEIFCKDFFFEAVIRNFFMEVFLKLVEIDLTGVL